MYIRGLYLKARRAGWHKINGFEFYQAMVDLL